jgi:hypothetical protein
MSDWDSVNGEHLSTRGNQGEEEHSPHGTKLIRLKSAADLSNHQSTTAPLRTRPWLASGWGCRGRRLSVEKVFVSGERP